MMRGKRDETGPKKRLTPDEAYARCSRYCAYQERSHKEARNKLFAYGLYPAEVEQTLTRLITEGFLNEERFARAFAGGKFRMQKWGRYKIKRALEGHGLSSRCVQRGLQEIEGAAYTKVLRSLLRRKLDAVKDENPLKARHKAGVFAIGKGYEPELVWEILKDLSGDE